MTTVTQADREAAARIEDWDEDHPQYADLMAGKLDTWTMVLAFARHREAAFEAGAKAMRERAEVAVDRALIVFAMPDANTSPDAMYSAGVRAIRALDPAQIAGGKP